MSHGEDIIVLQNNVVAVPAHRARNVQEYLRQRERHRAQLVGDVFCGVEMPHVETKERAFADRIAHVELVTSDCAGLDTDPEEL